MKKFMLLTALAAIIVGIVGCTPAEENNTDTTPPETTTPAE
jgi:hypothetical protein